MPPRTELGTDRAEAHQVERMLPPVPPRPRRRGRALGWAAAVAGAAVLFGGGWLAATSFESPAQQAAHAAAPKPGTITAEVSKGALEQIVTASATVQRQTRQTIAVPASGSPAVVTAAPIAAGHPVAPGAVVLEVDGQPVFAVPGRFAFYRDLTPGDTGPDVAQLQRALDAAGLRVTASGSFDAGTQAAVESLYRRAGYAPPQPLSVPATALIVAGALPANLVSAPAVGASIDDGTSITLETGRLIASAPVPPDSAAQLRKGMAVTLAGPSGKPAPASVASVAQPAKDGESATVTMTAASDLPAGWLHQAVLATITVQVAARDSLIVPSTAIVTAGNGQAHVLREAADGSFAEVPVTETATLSGKSAVTVAGGALEPGDTVRVG